MLKTMLDGLCRLVTLIIMALMAVIVVSITAQVFWRYVLNAALVWPEEVSRYAFIWSCLLGMSVGVRRGDLIAIDVLWVDRPRRIRLFVAVIARLLHIPLLLVLIWQGRALMDVVAGQLTASTEVPVSWVYLALPVSCVLALIFVFEALAANIRDLVSATEPRP
jgi:TRAP-type C4-dicarboxylate transport system permease small subunit